MWYGWIPVLSDHVPTVLHDRPLACCDPFILFESDSKDGSLKATYRSGDGSVVNIAINIVQGFFQMDCSDGLSHRRAYPIIQNLYDLLKRSYHADITHCDSPGLVAVEADSIKEASVRIANHLIRSNEDFLMEAGGLIDMGLTAFIYLKSRGAAEYGISYIERYKHLLEDSYPEYKERLTSVSRFIDAIYETKRNTIEDNAANQSQRVSESARSLSSIVLAMTIGSMIISCSAFLFDHQDLGSTTTVPIVSMAVAIPASIILYSYFVRRCSTSDCPGHSTSTRHRGPIRQMDGCSSLMAISPIYYPQIF